MRIDIMTLFPETLGDVLSESILGRAQERGIIRIESHQIRDYTANKQNQVDDYPYGGGRGAVMTADPLYRCWEAICDEAGGPVHTIYENGNFLAIVSGAHNGQVRRTNHEVGVLLGYVESVGGQLLLGHIRATLNAGVSGTEGQVAGSVFVKQRFVIQDILVGDGGVVGD